MQKGDSIVANEQNNQGFQQEQEEKRKQARREMEELQALLKAEQVSKPKPEPEQTPETPVEPQAEQPVKQPEPPTATQQAEPTKQPEKPVEPETVPEPKEELPEETVILQESLFRRAQEEQAKLEEMARQERIRQTSGAPRKKAATANKKAGTKKSEPRTAGTAGTPPRRKISREEAERRRKARRRRSLLRLGAVGILLLIVLIAASCTIRKALNAPENPEMNAGSAAVGSAVVDEPEDSAAAAAKAQSELPASQQESDQYLAIKDDTTLPDYAKEYPGMYSDARSVKTKDHEETGKVCYLTFDDGPSESVTPRILDTLQAYDVQATFFVVASQISGNEDLVQRMIDEGHTLCIHANVHEYTTIYESVEAYLSDFAEAYDTIYAATGYRVQGFRFPGGSNNGYITADDGLYSAIVTEMERRGFEYYDWNAYDGDAEGSSVPEPASLASRAVEEVMESSRNDVIVLMHDTYGKENTASALPSIIEGLEANDIPILPIDNSTRPVHFEVNDDTPSEYSGESMNSNEEPEDSTDTGAAIE